MIPKFLIAAATLAIFGLVNTEIFNKEDLRRNGQQIFLQLAPVDPRSLMQGDYMALDFALARDLNTELEKTPNQTQQNGSPLRQAVLTLDSQHNATFTRLEVPGSIPLPPAPNQVLFNFRLRQGRPWLGTNAFFFEEGSASRYQNARFGEFRVNAQGEAILVNLVEKLP